MPNTDFTPLLEAIDSRQKEVKAYLFAEENRVHFGHPHLDDAVYSYVKAGGKSLRPAVLMFCAGAMGGDERAALPAAAAVELYHTWTLVHDDIIDNDDLRRGHPTVHVEFAERARQELAYSPELAAHYGLSIAILAGDMQQGWAVSLLANLAQNPTIPPMLAINLINQLFRTVQIALVRGETLDIAYSRTPIEQLSDNQVIDMLWQKTGILYDFAGRAGAAIGLRETDLSRREVEQVASFTGKCGIAFQIQDDILGITGQEKQLGKPVGSDIREGKRTLIVLEAMRRINSAEKSFALSVLGNPDAESADITEFIDLMRRCGAIAHTEDLARGYVEEALSNIADLPNSDYKNLLHLWAGYMIDRSF